MSNWTDAFYDDCAGDLSTRFQIFDSSSSIDPDFIEPDQGTIDAHHILRLLYAPRHHLDGYDTMLGNLARYTARSQQPTRELENSITIVRQTRRRAVEVKQLWPYVSNFTSHELGQLPKENETQIDVSKLPRPLTRMVGSVSVLTKRFSG